MIRTTNLRVHGGLTAALLLAIATGCSPSTIVGPLAHQQDERERVMERARKASLPTDLLEKVFPPLTPGERQLEEEQNSSCRSSYVWKNALVWTGSALITGSAGIVVGGAIATGNSDTESRIAYGISAGSMAALGSGLAAIAGIIEGRYVDRGCTTKVETPPDKLSELPKKL